MAAMTCDRFEAMLPDYLEGDLSDEDRAAAESHAKACDSCARIVGDMERITRDAALLPALTPGRDLWQGIEQRTSARFLPLAPAEHPGVRRFGGGWMAAAAAALVVTTAGITYLVTSDRTGSETARVAAATPKPVAPAVDSPVGAVPSTTAPASAARVPDYAPSITGSRRVGNFVASVASGRISPAPRTSVALNASATTGSVQGDAAYAREIGILERMVNRPGSGLDPATVEVVKRNLQVIDDAIAQSRAALAKDPASALLYGQMKRAMDKKVELLRTAVSLSSGT